MITGHEWLEIFLAALAGYFCGWGHGCKWAGKISQPAIARAADDYREAVQIITKLRNRLNAQRWLRVRTGVDMRKDPKPLARTSRGDELTT